jgi:hypothetical protein
MSSQSRRVILDVDSRGRISLARFGYKSGQLVVDELADGGLVIHRAVALTPVEAAHYLNEEAVAALDRAMAEVESGRLRKVPLRSQRDLPARL